MTADTHPGSDRMPAAEALAGDPVRAGEAGLPDSSPRPNRSGERFVRMRLRVEDDSLTVHSARYVEGGHLVERPLLPGYVYEVSVQDRRIWAANVPDFGVRRSFPDPQGPPERQVHHLTPVPNPPVEVRIPASELRTTPLEQIEVAVYELAASAAASAAPSAAASAVAPAAAAADTPVVAEPAPLSTFPPDAARLVARTRPGVLANLQAEHAAEVRRALDA